MILDFKKTFYKDLDKLKNSDISRNLSLIIEKLKNDK